MLGGRGDGGGGVVSNEAESGANAAAASARTCDHDDGSCVAGMQFDVDVGIGTRRRKNLKQMLEMWRQRRGVSVCIPVPCGVARWKLAVPHYVSAVKLRVSFEEMATTRNAKKEQFELKTSDKKTEAKQANEHSHIPNTHVAPIMS
jgi:hypothetical protein